MIAQRIAGMAVGLLISACSLQQPPAWRGSNPIPAATLSETSSVDAATPRRRDFFALDEFRPITARPNYAAFAKAIEMDDQSKAQDLVNQQLRLLDGTELRRWHLWLGYAYRKRNELAQALYHFRQAASASWLLADYARLAEAESLVALGAATEALQTLDGMNCSGPVASSVQALQAEVAAQTGQLQRAIALWRVALNQPTLTGPARASVSLMLAEALIQLSNRQDSEVGRGDAADTHTAVDAFRQEAFDRLEPSQTRELDVAMQQRAVELRADLISMVMVGQPLEQQQCKLSDRIVELELLVERRELNRALPLAVSLLEELKEPNQRHTMSGCRVLFALAQLHWFNGEAKQASTLFDAVGSNCSTPEDLVARALFQSGRRLQDQHELTAAIQQFESLERRFPQHRLADDARLRLANAYLELGSEAKFVELVLRMPDDYPSGDQVPEGLFQLALHRMTKGDWPGTESLLTTIGKLPRIEQRDDAEQAERQIYFLARARLEIGQVDAALRLLEQLVRERPFSYYMLLAYAQLMQRVPERAAQARDAGLAATASSPFVLAYQPQLDTPGFARAMELLALGESEKASRELKALGLSKELELQLLWIKATYEAAGGELKATQKIVRERLREWTRYWPGGAWEAAWKIAYPQPYYDLVKRETQRTEVPIPLAYAIMREESLFDQEAVSAADAHGLMQLIVPTAKTAAKELGIAASARTLQQPAVNIALGCQVLKRLLERFSKQPLLAIPAYNAGPGRPARWIKERPDMDFDIWVESIPFIETRTYFKHVLASRAAYAWLYDHALAENAMRLPMRIAD